MPIEIAILKDWRVPLRECPRCQAKPFVPFMRGMVRDSWRGFWHKPEWCLICSRCKGIVGYERAMVRPTFRQSLDDLSDYLLAKFLYYSYKLRYPPRVRHP